MHDALDPSVIGLGRKTRRTEREIRLVAHAHVLQRRQQQVFHALDFVSHLIDARDGNVADRYLQTVEGTLRSVDDFDVPNFFRLLLLVLRPPQDDLHILLTLGRVTMFY